MTHVQENTTVARRANALRKTRQFFDSRGFLEVDPPHLLSYSSIDAHIDPVETLDGRFLHTSPEYAMKKLLSEGHEEIYFLGHVFRKEEKSPIHAEEFTMVEWYTQKSEKQFLQEVEDFFALFLEKTGTTYISYEDAWSRYAKNTLPNQDWDSDTKRDYIWSTHVEPHLGKNGLEVVYNFPPELALLSQVVQESGKSVAKRFEWYYQGIELGNAFWELSDYKEHALRFNQENEKRKHNNKKILQPDPTFLQAVEKGFSETYGIACGFDRLFMLQEQSPSLFSL